MDGYFTMLFAWVFLINKVKCDIEPFGYQPQYVQCFHFVKNKAYKVLLQYSSYDRGFFDYDMSYIVALFMCLLFTMFQHWTYFPTALSAPPPTIPLPKLSKGPTNLLKLL